MANEEFVPIVPLEAWKLIMVHDNAVAGGPVVWASRTSTQLMIGDPTTIPTINQSPDYFPLPRLIMTVEQARSLAGALVQAADIEERRANAERGIPAGGITIVNPDPGSGGGPDSPTGAA